jgi:hypothetical protein
MKMTVIFLATVALVSISVAALPTTVSSEDLIARAADPVIGRLCWFRGEGCGKKVMRGPEAQPEPEPMPEPEPEPQPTSAPLPEAEPEPVIGRLCWFRGEGCGKVKRNADGSLEEIGEYDSVTPAEFAEVSE